MTTDPLFHKQFWLMLKFGMKFCRFCIMHPLLDDVGELKQLCMLEACPTDNIPDWLSFFFQAENVPDQLIINMDVDMEMEMEM
jgi:hypothetical protein